MLSDNTRKLILQDRAKALAELLGETRQNNGATNFGNATDNKTFISNIIKRFKTSGDERKR